ncbi:accessory Sec system protein Asp3 [Weissella coleopterorum]|uniref:Accessory Sec system protein Asp3 n=1 Tax=Weissella coleopterorum TaxID=2714949 RepID=A0A6G8AZN4_9LACO|nr:accessory Sec system protein Asp3 [Weissella coleopterorum]QIL50447.1 accessory Sec system protein Asp3 [Weissella coleopterorum]
MEFEIKWVPELMDFYKYGSKIAFDAQGDVLFINPLMPAGTEIVKWQSNPFYQGARTLLQLPLLKRKMEYELEVGLESIPAMSALVMIVYFDRYGHRIGSKILDLKGGDITYPEKAYTYEIRVINKGAQEIRFEKITIRTKEEKKEDNTTEEIHG